MELTIFSTEGEAVTTLILRWILHRPFYQLMPPTAMFGHCREPHNISVHVDFSGLSTTELYN
jgi:hypothetical protein